MLVLHNVRMISLNARKNKGSPKCDRSTIICDIGNAQCEDGTIKCKKKNKGITKCDKITVTCDVGIIQYKDGTTKYVKNKGTTEGGRSTVIYDFGSP